MTRLVQWVGRRESPHLHIPHMPLIYHRATWAERLAYDVWLYIFAICFNNFFREIRPRGAFRLPKSGPVIFVAAPHANQFVDPYVLMQQVKMEAGRRVSFLVADKTYQTPIIGQFARYQCAIPVLRPQDMLTNATGRIYIKEDPLTIHGTGTCFTKECMERGLLALPQLLGAVEIVKIVSDTELQIKKEFKKSTQIAVLTKGTRFKVAPKIDQKEVYKYVFQHLSEGNCLGIFPEGGSHDRPDMLPLKAGVAVMALGAMANDSGCKVKIVPCGMNYFNAHRFRLRAVVEFGHPIDISSDLVKKYQNPATSREAVKELLETVTTGLRAVTVNCADYETLMVVQAARRLYAGNFAQQLPLPLVVEMNRRLVLGYERYAAEPEIVALKAKILRYNRVLKHLYLPDHNVEQCDEQHKLRVLPILFARLVKMVVCCTLALPGSVLFSPVFLLAKLISASKARNALANSTVKIKANDVVATWKILISAGFAPILYSFYASAATFYCKRNGILSSFGLFWLWVFLYIAGILVTYSALITGEQGLDLLKLIRPLYLLIFLSSAIVDLKRMRRELSEEITDIVNRFGPELFPDDFNLLKMKDALRMEKTPYVDSDEEEEKKTMQLRQRRRAARRNELPGTSLDGLSSLSTDMSYTNMPLFSDYALHKNARDAHLEDYLDILRLSSQMELNFTPQQQALHEKIQKKMQRD